MITPEPFLFRHSTRQIIYASGALASIGELVKTRRLRRVALVIDGFFRDSEASDRVRGLVERNGAAFAVHAPPVQEPDTDTVEECRRFLAEFGPDCVLAIGGGSTMDTAKVARIMLSNPGEVAEAAGFDREFLPHPSLFVCMPTTAGTGSEVSEMAVVSLAGSDVKLRYRSQNMTAEVAVLDPELTVSTPPSVTAACGFDALTHAVEGDRRSRGPGVLHARGQRFVRVAAAHLDKDLGHVAHFAAHCRLLRRPLLPNTSLWVHFRRLAVNLTVDKLT